MQLAVRCRRDIGKNLHFGGAVAAGIGEDVELLKQRLAVGKHRHDAAPLASAAGVFRSVESLGEVQTQFVGSGLKWNVVSEVSLTAAAIDNGLLGAPDVLDRALNRVAAGEVRIRTPKLAGMIHILSTSPAEDANLFAYGKADSGFGGSLRRI